MSEKVTLSVGDDEVEIGTIGEVINLLGSVFHELNGQSRVAYRIAVFIASVAESLIHDPDHNAEIIRIDIK